MNWRRTIGHNFELTAANALASGKAYAVVVHYSDLEPLLVDESTLALFYWHGSQWVKEP